MTIKQPMNSQSCMQVLKLLKQYSVIIPHIISSQNDLTLNVINDIIFCLYF